MRYAFIGLLFALASCSVSLNPIPGVSVSIPVLPDMGQSDHRHSKDDGEHQSSED